MSKWEYGKAYIEHPIKEGQVAIFENGSKVAVHDIFKPLPAFMGEADIIFVDPPWNLGNLNSFYTKAERTDYKDNFEEFYKRLFECIKEISPKVCYVEVGKEYLADFIFEMRKLYKSVTFYNSTYYHQKERICYVIRGASKYKKLPLDYMDEEDIIAWICKNEDYETIGDLCIGKGLVAVNAYRNGKKFVGTELNPKRVSVLLKEVSRLGGKYIVKDLFDIV
jgi:DNA modification methylase